MCAAITLSSNISYGGEMKKARCLHSFFTYNFTNSRVMISSISAIYAAAFSFMQNVMPNLHSPTRKRTSLTRGLHKSFRLLRYTLGSISFHSFELLSSSGTAHLHCSALTTISAKKSLPFSPGPSLFRNARDEKGFCQNSYIRFLASVPSLSGKHNTRSSCVYYEH